MLLAMKLDSNAIFGRPVVLLTSSSNNFDCIDIGIVINFPRSIVPNGNENKLYRYQRTLTSTITFPSFVSDLESPCGLDSGRGSMFLL